MKKENIESKEVEIQKVKSKKKTTKKRNIKLDNFEVRVIINSLNEKRTKLIELGEETDIIDDIILKYLDVLEKL